MSKNTNRRFSRLEERFMRRALQLAQRGFGKTAPNPMVGAVVVKNNKIIGEAYHHKAGEPHAEVLALRGLSKARLHDATLYVTLEPCCHPDKRTPPCTDLLMRSGLRSAVVAVKDPNPMVNGRGIVRLRKAGMEVRTGLLAEAAEELNEIFIKNMRSRLPFVVIKLALSLDGKIATVSGDSRWITSSESRQYLHKLRSHYDAVITSSSTVISDNPHLGVRKVKGRDPFRLIIDRKLLTDRGAQVYRDKNVLVATTAQAPAEKIKAFRAAEISLKIYPEHFLLSRLLKDLRKMGVNSVLVEAGGTLVSAFIKEKLVDKYMFFLAPKIIGGDGKNAVGDLGIKKIKDAAVFKKTQLRKFGNDILIEAKSYS